MKKALSIGLILIMMLSTLPLTIVKNHCPVKNETKIAFVSEAQSKCCCNKNTKRTINDCCSRNVVKLNVIKDAYAPALKLSIPKNVWSTVFSAFVTNRSSIISQQSYQLLAKAFSKSWHIPPNSPISLRVLHSSFLI